jgi:hypothetical protein
MSVPVMMGIASPTGSHLPALVSVLDSLAPDSLVIEHGAGMYSTPLLCRYPLRVLCAEGHPGWSEWARWMYAGRDAEVVDSFKRAVPRLPEASAVFVDGEARERGPLIKCALEAGVANIIAHDTEESDWNHYKLMAHYFEYRGYSIRHYDDSHRTTLWQRR